jgi:NAD(P)-dependent dehydrogenase (short-subunit alcohol dehydrogenase family)
VTATSSTGRLAGKVAVVTGGASGIGLAAVRRFVAEGARVVIGDIDGDRLSAAEPDLGDAVVRHRCDVRAENDVEALMAAAEDRFGALHVAFANAGTGSIAPIMDADPADWMRVIEVNLLGPLLTVKHAARRMPHGGSIILTASLNAVQPAAGMSAYCCSKAGLAMLAQVAALELGRNGIRVNAIGPGLVRTGMTEAMWLAPSIIGEFEENAPLGTAITPDDVAGLVAFLASDEAAAISGSLYLIDGAAHTKRYPDLLARLAEAARAAGAAPAT